MSITKLDNQTILDDWIITINNLIDTTNNLENNKANKSTTLAGYSIKDAKISSGTITLGTNSIVPLSSNSNIDASKITGTLSGTVVVPAEKVSGTLSNATIPGSKITGTITTAKVQGSNVIGTIKSSLITPMTGYTKAEVAGTITTSDSLNTALGKLEKQIESKNGLPSFGGTANAGKFLTTDGTTARWITFDESNLVHIDSGSVEEVIKNPKTFNSYSKFSNTLGASDVSSTSSGTAINVSSSTKSYFRIKITNNCTIKLSALAATNYCTVINLQLVNGGNYVVAWEPNVFWTDGEPPELTKNGTDIITLLYSGSEWYGIHSLMNAKISS